MQESQRSLTHLGVQLVGQGLEIDGGGRDLLATGGVVAVGEVTTRGQVESHHAVVGVQEGGVHGEVGRAGMSNTTMHC